MEHDSANKVSPIDFLRHLSPNGPWALASILDGKVGTCNDRAKAEDWIAMENGTRNLHFNLNEIRPGLVGRPKKADIAAARGFHIDIDPREGADLVGEQRRILATLLAFPIPAPVIIFSGGGYNAIWPLKEPYPLNGPKSVERIELVNRKLERWFGSKDGCFNIDRLLRLPGTTNVLNEKKRAEGRQPTMSELVKADWTVRYSLEDLEGWPALPEQARWWLGPLMLTGQNPERAESYPSRSEATWAAACELVRSGASDELIMELLLDRRLATSSHIYDQDRPPEKYAAKQIKQARKEVEEDEKRGRPSHANLLMKIGSEVDLFRTPMREAYAAWTVDGHRECSPVDSSSFQTYLRTEFRKQTDGGLPTSEAMKAAVLALADDARRGEEHRVFLRVAGLGERVVIDMGTEDWRAIEIDASGWRVVSQPDVYFRRMPGMRALPEPIADGKFSDIRRFLNLSSQNDLYLTTGFLLGCLQPSIDVPYPLLVLSGETGSAKTTFTKVVVGLIDPRVAPVLSRPRKVEDLFINARDNYLLAFNNLSSISLDMSDALCLIGDGEGGYSPRKLYTHDSIMFNDHRPVVLNGIPDVVSQPDLMDRSIKIQLKPIPEDEYRSDEEFGAGLEAEKPKLLGALFSLVSTGLRNLATMPALKHSTRMARFVQWVSACTHEVSPGEFARVFLENRVEAGRQLVETDSVATALMRMMQRGERGPFEGTVGQLMEILHGYSELGFGMKSSDWPKNPTLMSGKLRRLAPLIRRDGIEIEFDVRISRDVKRGIRIYKRAVEN